ncbi:MAG: DUF4386 domain-containing protein [Bacteroidota bacterium]
MAHYQSRKLAGIIFIVVPILINIPYGMLIAGFQYPDILRQPAGEILAKFHEGGSGLILTWWAFGFIGIPLIYPVIGLHSLLQQEDTPYLLTGTACGVISLVAQFVGLLRWTFVVPSLAEVYVNPASSQATRDAAVIAFQTIHQYGGVVIGEHIGQLFTVVWMFLVGAAMMKSPAFRPWLGWFGIISGAIYLLAQLELFATVIPGIPVITIARLLGSILWLMWMVLIGIAMLRMRPVA